MIEAIITSRPGKNCFLGIPRNYLSKFSANRDGVIVVKVEFETERGPIFVTATQAAASKRHAGTGEVKVALNSIFAEANFIKMGDRVLITPLSEDILHCQWMEISVAAKDEEVMALNKSSLEKMLLDQIRVVAPEMKLPIWPGNANNYIIVTVLATTPSCSSKSCVLLTQNTKVKLKIATQTRSVSRQSSARGSSGTDGTDDSVDGKGGLTSLFSSLFNSKENSPNLQLPEQDPRGSAGFGHLFSYFFPNKQDSQEVSEKPRAVSAMGNHETAPEEETSVTHIGTTSKENELKRKGHQKQPSLPVNLEAVSFNREKLAKERLTSEYINTPPLTAEFRVQPRVGAFPKPSHVSPYSSSQVGNICPSCSHGSVPYDLEGVVHPDSLPAIFNSTLQLQSHSPTTVFNYIVEIKRIPPPEALKREPEETVEEISTKDDLPPSFSWIRTGKEGTKDNKSEELADLWDVRQPSTLAIRLIVTPDLHPPTNGPPTSGKGSSVDTSPSQEFFVDVPPSNVNWLNGPAECVSVTPGHVVLSDTVRQQLDIGLFSRVSLSDVQENHKCLCHGITIQPLHYHKVLTENSLKKAFLTWMRKEASSPGRSVPLTHNIIIPLKVENKTKPVYCRIMLELKVMNLKEPRVHKYQFCLVYPSDIGKKIALQVDDAAKEKANKNKLPAVPKPLQEIDSFLCHDSLPLLGGFAELQTECIRYLRSMLSSQSCKQLFGRVYTPGCLLISGVGEGFGRGCGRTSLVRSVARTMMEGPYHVFVHEFDPVSFRGKRSSITKRHLKNAFNTIEYHQPSILVMENLDLLCYDMAESDHVNELYIAQRALIFLKELMADIQEKGLQCVVIATCESKTLLLKDLVNPRISHNFFGKTVIISPPTLPQCVEILDCAVIRKEVSHMLTLPQKKDIARRMDGFQPADVVAIVERAIRTAKARLSGNFMSKGVVIQSSHFLSGAGPDTPTKSDPDSIHSKGNRSESVITVVDQQPNALIQDDFLTALKGFIPAALFSIPLVKSSEHTFQNIGGLHEVKDLLKQHILWPSKYPKLYKSLHADRKCGFLLFGPPGTGKTLIAQSVSKEFGLNYISVKGPELLNKYIGASEEAVRDIFTKAQSAKPCVLFFDEFDSLVPRRGHDSTGTTDRVVNQLLTQLDGIEGLIGVYLIAATSRPDMIDPALLRPGRIDKRLYCPLPSSSERHEILQALSSNLILEDVDLEMVSKNCEHFSGADLKALLYNAQLSAAHEELAARKSSLEMNPIYSIKEDEEELEFTLESSRGAVQSSFREYEALDVATAKDVCTGGELLLPPQSRSSPSSPKRDALLNTRNPVLQINGLKFSRSISETGSHHGKEGRLNLRRKPLNKAGYVSYPNSTGIVAKDSSGDVAKRKLSLIQRNKKFSPRWEWNYAAYDTNAEAKLSESGPVRGCVIKQAHMLNALQTTFPSLSKADRLHYQSVCTRFVKNEKQTIKDFLNQKATLS